MTLNVGHHGWLTKKILGFGSSQKTKITLENISFWQKYFYQRFQIFSIYIYSDNLPIKSYRFFKICKRLDKEREKALVQQSMRKEKTRKVGLCFCFMKSFNMIMNHIFVLQAHLQPNFCFFDFRMTQEISKGEVGNGK